ncbi:MAG: diguanylate cyclase [Sulfurimonas sp.]|jgi:diguanylate cyclase (GGDEF)-like protein
MSGTLRSRNRREIGSDSNSALEMEEPTSDIEIYAKEVLNSLINDNLPPTPNNFSLYFDRLLEKKSEIVRKQIVSMLELEEDNDGEKTIILEQSLKQGFSSIKNILSITASLYKNMALMTKILDKRKEELKQGSNVQSVAGIVGVLEGDISKLNTILSKQSTQLKDLYDETATVVKSVENETIFDNKFGVYNKRYLLTKIANEIGLIKQFNHKSSLIMIELDRDLQESVNNEKAVVLMTRTIARLLLKTSRRSDIVAHYGNGIFTMLLKHTDLGSAKHASGRLCELVSNSNFFLSDREIQLKIAIGITDITPEYSVEETIVNAMSGIEKSYAEESVDYAVVTRSEETQKAEE